jgi:hypothetical protein
MTILDRIKLWNTASLSLVCNDLLEMGYCCTIEYRQHNCETGKWISITVEKDGQTWGGIGGSRLEIARNRLVEWADRQGIRDSFIS